MVGPEKTLVIITAQDRELDATYQSLHRNVLTPLNADLAFCGAAASEITRRKTSFLWEKDEPTNWLEEFLALGLSRAQITAFENLGPEFFAGLGSGRGSAAIVFYWRYMLSQAYQTENRNWNYDWYAITRSDMMWASPFPSIKWFSRKNIYYLASEHYGGIEDRFVLFHRTKALEMFSLYSDIFLEPESSLRTLENFRKSGSKKPRKLNAEGYQYLQLKRRGLLNNVRYLPYIGFTIRSCAGTSRWSTGVWDEAEQVFVKYPSERRQAKHFARFIVGIDDWGRFPSFPPGRKLLLAYATWQFKRFRRALRKKSSRGRNRV